MSFIMLDLKCSSCGKISEKLVKSDNGKMRDNGETECECGQILLNADRLISSPAGIHMSASPGRVDDSIYTPRNKR